MKIKDLKNKKIAILGFGVEGKSTLNFLLEQNIRKENISILDKTFPQPIPCKEESIKIISGDNYLDNLGDFDVIIKSPGISPYHPKIIPYKDSLASQTEIFFSNYSGKVIGVTATKGKTTTVSILYETLKNGGYTVKLVGNIGKPVLEEINLNNTYDYIIYELSSYMLEGFSPKLYIGVLGNIFPDHIDWHNNSFEIYKQAKLNILRNAKHKIMHSELLPLLNKEGIEGGSCVNSILKNIETPLFGEHNIKNISLVWRICQIIGVKKETLLETVKTFQAVPHRLQKVAEKNGIIFIDDAISTTPESTIEAIKTFGETIGTIFLGGLDRGYNFGKLVKYLEKYNIKNIVLFPETGNLILPLLNKERTDGWSILQTSSMKEAIVFAFENCKVGEICLLSTASPSYNLYKNYIEQGEKFLEEIKTY